MLGFGGVYWCMEKQQSVYQESLAQGFDGSENPIKIEYWNIES